MSVYHQYTKNIKARYLALYWCEGCHKYAVQSVHSTAFVTYNDKGTFTKSGRDSREAAADEKALKWAQDVREGVLNSRMKIFRKANLKHRCPQCRKKPVWANMDFSILDNLSLLSLFAALFVWYFSRDTGTSPWVFVLLAVAALAFAGKFVLYAVCEAKIKKDMEQHMLLFAPTLDDLRQKAEASPLYAGNVDWPQQ